MTTVDVTVEVRVVKVVCDEKLALLVVSEVVECIIMIDESDRLVLWFVKIGVDEDTIDEVDIVRRRRTRSSSRSTGPNVEVGGRRERMSVLPHASISLRFMTATSHQSLSSMVRDQRPRCDRVGKRERS